MRFKSLIIIATLILAFTFSAFGFEGSCALTLDQRARKDTASKLSPTDKATLFKTQWTREAAGLRTQGQRDTLAFWTNIIDEVYASDTGARGFYETDLGKRVKQGIKLEKMNFSGTEIKNIFEVPQADLLSRFTSKTMFTQAKLPSSGLLVPPNCSCAAVISLCSWTDGCFTPVECRQTVACGPGEAFVCDIICNKKPEELD